MDNDKSIQVLFAYSCGKDSEKLDRWLGFPTTKEKFGQFLKEVNAEGMAGADMTAMFCEGGVTSPISGLSGLPFDEDTVNELNYFAARLQKCDNDGIEKFEAIIESGRHIREDGGVSLIGDYINILENLDSFTFFSGYGAQEYGEHLLSGPQNRVTDLIRFLQNYYGAEGEDFANYVEALRDCADAEQFGQSMSYNDNGEFLSSGYLIEEEGFYAYYQGVADIPAEYRVWEPGEAFIKAMDIDLSTFLLEMHAVGGNYTQDAVNNYQTLINGGDFFITESDGKLTVIAAEKAFNKDSAEYTMLQDGCDSDARAFYLTVKNIDGNGYWGNIHEINASEIKNEVGRLSYGAVSVDAEFKDGANRLYTINEWNDLSNADRNRVAGMVFRYDPADEQKAGELLSGLREIGENKGRAVTREDLLAYMNEPFMSKAQNRQPDMLRVARDAANIMLARSDAEVYRLTPEGAVKLTPIDAVKSGGLWFKEHREFAIKTGGLAGLMKWAERTAGDIKRQTEKEERGKSQDKEL